jgi:hypothetical protein
MHSFFPPFVILILLGEVYKLWSSSLCSFLQTSVTSSLFGPNVVLLSSGDIFGKGYMQKETLHKCLMSPFLQLTTQQHNDRRLVCH